ncbi:hypothetical protein CRG98_047059 [Punica granatum]|uniref:Uncharacterized protein n=1 Tax=Punica granatum TaxID=22663 RepID=A0A2I0HLM6_PUNGR|nr:hypothetical protein CRG98_047059 [Punica granatum]
MTSAHKYEGTYEEVQFHHYCFLLCLFQNLIPRLCNLPSRGATSAFILLKASSLRWIDRLSQAGRAHAGLRCWRPRFQPRLLTSSFASQGQPGGGILTLQENEHEHDCIAATDDHGPDIGPHLHE